MTNQTIVKRQPLVSVILPTYNRASTLARAMHSVLGQTWENLELIVADDGSTDHTRELVADFTDPRVRYVWHEPNGGAAAARNLGLAHARGEFIAFQDSDDEWLLDKLKMQLVALDSCGSEYGATFGGKLTYGRNPAGRLGDGLCVYYPHQAKSVRSGHITSQLLVQNLISPQTLLVKASVAQKTGPFDERLRSNVDWDYMIRLSMKTQVLYTNRPVVVAYFSGDSVSLNSRTNCQAFLLITKKYENLFRENPKAYSDKYYGAARDLQRLKRYRSAGRVLRRAIKLYPWSYKAWIRLFEAWLNDAVLAVPGPARFNERRMPARSRPAFGADRLVRASADAARQDL